MPYPPKKNTAYIFRIGLISRTTGQLQVNPAIVAGDFQISIDNGAFTNLFNLPSVQPAAGRALQISLTASEMNGDDIVIVGSDAAGDEWNDVFINFQTSVRTIDDLLYPTYPLIDSIPADGSLPNVQQAIYMINQFHNERVTAGTVVSIKKVDGSTTLYTCSLNDAVNPTSITRST